MQPNLNSQATKLLEHNATLSSVPHLLNAALFLSSSILSVIAIAAAAETPSQMYAESSNQVYGKPLQEESLQVEIPVLGMDRIYGESKPAFVQNDLELEDLANKQWTRVEQHTDLMIDPESLIEQTAIYQQQLAQSLKRQQQSARQNPNAEGYVRSITPHIVRLPSMPLLRDLATSQDPEALQHKVENKPEEDLKLADNTNSVSIINPLFSDLYTGFADTPDPKLALAQLSQQAQAQQVMHPSIEGMNNRSISSRINSDALANNAAMADKATLASVDSSTQKLALSNTKSSTSYTVEMGTTSAPNAKREANVTGLTATVAVYPSHITALASTHNNSSSQAVFSERSAIDIKNAALQPMRDKGELTSTTRSQMHTVRSSQYYNLNQSNMSYMAQALEQARYLATPRTTFAPVSSWSNPFFAQSLVAPQGAQMNRVIAANAQGSVSTNTSRTALEVMKNTGNGNYAITASSLDMRKALTESLHQQGQTALWNAQAYIFRRDDAQTATERQLTAALSNSGQPLVSSLASGSAMLGQAYPMAFSNRRPSNRALKSVVMAAANSSLAMSVEHRGNPNYKDPSAYSIVSSAVLNAAQNQNITTASSMIDADGSSNLAANKLSSTTFASSATQSSVHSAIHASVSFSANGTERSSWLAKNKQYQSSQNQSNTLLSSNYGNNQVTYGANSGVILVSKEQGNNSLTNNLASVDAAGKDSTGLNNDISVGTSLNSTVDANLEVTTTLADGKANVALTSDVADLSNIVNDNTDAANSSLNNASLANLSNTSNLNEATNGSLDSAAGNSLTIELSDNSSNSVLASQNDSQLDGGLSTGELSTDTNKKLTLNTSSSAQSGIVNSGATGNLNSSLVQSDAVDQNNALTNGAVSDGQSLASTDGNTDSSLNTAANPEVSSNSSSASSVSSATANTSGATADSTNTDNSLTANNSASSSNEGTANENLANENESSAAEQDSTLAATTESSLNNNKAESNVSSSALANKEEASSPNEVMSQKLEKASRLGLYGGGAQAALMAGNATIDLIYSRMGLRSLPDNIQPYAAQPNEPDVWLHPNGIQVWVSPVYRHRDATALQFNNSSYGADINLYGLAVGTDYTFERAFSIGMVFNMGAGDATGKGASQGISNDFDYYGGAFYGGCKFDNFSLLGDITYTKVDNQFDSVADFEHVTASMNSEHFSVGVTGQYEFKVNPRLSVTPHLGLRYNSIDLKDYNIESLSDRIVYDMDSLKFISLPAGVTFTHTYRSSEWLIQPAADFTITVNMMDTALQGDIIWDTPRRYRFKMHSEVIEEFTWRTTFGLAASCKNFNLGLNISYTGSADSHEYGLMGSVHWKF